LQGAKPFCNIRHLQVAETREDSSFSATSAEEMEERARQEAVDRTRQWVDGARFEEHRPYHPLQRPTAAVAPRVLVEEIPLPPEEDRETAAFGSGSSLETSV
jgi:hypothetical protein